MISEKMKSLLSGSSAIRAMFEEGKKLAAVYGKDAVYDFSLGNPNTPPPEAFGEAVIRLVETEAPMKLHGYMTNAGHPEVREKIAAKLNKTYGTAYSSRNIIMTVGAAGGLNVILKTLLNPEDEVLTFSPYFGEYRHYADNFGGKLIAVPTNPSENFRPNLSDLKKCITRKTKALILNNPNNPTGIVYTEEEIRSVSEVLSEKEKEFGTSIFLISDEPYRELTYDGISVPFPPLYYKNTVLCYSYSKSLSLAGERIGYLLIPDAPDDASEMILAAETATRILGFVNAPSLMQLAVADCLEEKVPVETYDTNRKLLYQSLTDMGFSCVKPEGAFYLFMKTPVEDREFVETAKNFRLLLVPASAFGCPGFVRIAYCVKTETVKNSLEAFRKLAAHYNLKKRT